MASGFLQRYQGKIKAAVVYLGSGGLVNSLTGTVTSRNDLGNISGSTTIATASTAALTIAGSGVTKVPLASGLTYALGAPSNGCRAILFSTDVGLGARKISSTASGAIVQSTLASAQFINLSTTLTDTLELRGISTAYWIIGANRGAATVSTS